jgi:long-chain acyl-CoA synthetase
MGYIGPGNMAYPSLTACLLETIDKKPNPKAQIFKGASAWESISSAEMLRRIAGLAKALAELGVKTGDRVALFAPNCPEWHVADFAIMGLGAAGVPIYFNESVERLSYILNDSGARVVITSGEDQARKISENRARFPGTEHVIAVKPPTDLRGEILKYDTLIAAATDADIEEYRRRASKVASNELATLIYTSGTTGEPKGVMLSHSNLSSNALESAQDFEFLPGDVGLSFLPLAHVYERVVDYSYIFRGVSVAYVERIETVAQAILEVKPTTLAAVPRFFEKIYAGILEKGHKETGVKRKIFDWALGVAQQSVPWKAHGKSAPALLQWKWKLADKLVYSKVRENLGGNIRSMCSGGAPLSPELGEFFWALNLPVYQGYGLTETSPVVSGNRPDAFKVGTVGKVIPNVTVSIAEDGEILVKGPNVMQGYYRKPDETQKVFTPAGWFCTGDIGRIDEDGYLVITDRKKELLKTAAGKFVAPAPIENALKTSHFILNAIVVGDKRKFPALIIVPNFPTVEAEAKNQNKEVGTPTQMIHDPWVRDLIAAEIERLTAPLAQYEKPKRFSLIERDFAYASGELTYTMKMKRRVIEQHYEDVIAQMYADVEEPKPQPQA